MLVTYYVLPVLTRFVFVEPCLQVMHTVVAPLSTFRVWLTDFLDQHPLDHLQISSILRDKAVIDIRMPMALWIGLNLFWTALPFWRKITRK